jgi:predicted RNA methylase
VTCFEALAAGYERWPADMTEDVPFYVELAQEVDGPVVELAVGTGRAAIPVAAAIGRTVIGIDASPAMLERARSAGGDALDLRLGLIDVSSLEVEAFSGWFDRRPVAGDSRELVWIARTPG